MNTTPDTAKGRRQISAFLPAFGTAADPNKEHLEEPKKNKKNYGIQANKLRQEEKEKKINLTNFAPKASAPRKQNQMIDAKAPKTPRSPAPVATNLDGRQDLPMSQERRREPRSSGNLGPLLAFILLVCWLAPLLS